MRALNLLRRALVAYQIWSIRVTIAGQALIVLRQAEGAFGVFFNRCAHKGSALVTDRQGCAGRTLRCPYHGWSYRLDGSLIGVPNKGDYTHAAFDSCDASRGLTPVATAVHRGFVFVRVSARGPAFEDQMAPLLSVIDLIAAGTISGKMAKDLFEIVYTEGGDPAAIADARGMKQVTDTGAIEKAVDEIIAANPDQVAKAKANPKLAGWFTGQVIKASGGKANPATVNALVAAKLGL